MREFLLLELRNAIADKECAVACANRDLALGAWTRNWAVLMAEAEREVQYLIREISRDKKVGSDSTAEVDLTLQTR